MFQFKLVLGFKKESNFFISSKKLFTFLSFEGEMIRDLKTPPFQFRETKIFIFNFFFLTSNSNYLFSSLLSLLSQTEIFTKTLEFKFLANNISMLFFNIKIIFRFANLYLTDIFSLKCLDFYLTCHMIRLIIITWPLPLSLSFFLSVHPSFFLSVSTILRLSEIVRLSFHANYRIILKFESPFCFLAKRFVIILLFSYL
jgi:hypothetical protein